ncbi:MAG: hypothetical protein IJU92_04800 [Spirochaetaceae bacterium]|nr:hypothetical protein [Spirochaetaceae bacterium]
MKRSFVLCVVFFMLALILFGCSGKDNAVDNSTNLDNAVEHSLSTDYEAENNADNTDFDYDYVMQYWQLYEMGENNYVRQGSFRLDTCIEAYDGWVEYGWPSNTLMIERTDEYLTYFVTMEIRAYGGIIITGEATFTPYKLIMNDAELTIPENTVNERLDLILEFTDDSNIEVSLAKDSISDYIDKTTFLYVPYVVPDDFSTDPWYPKGFTYPEAADRRTPSEELLGTWHNVDDIDVTLTFTYQMKELYPETFFPEYSCEWADDAKDFTRTWTLSSPDDSYQEYRCYYENFYDVEAWMWFERIASGELVLHFYDLAGRRSTFIKD